MLLSQPTAWQPRTTKPLINFREPLHPFISNPAVPATSDMHGGGGGPFTSFVGQSSRSTGALRVSAHATQSERQTDLEAQRIPRSLTRRLTARYTVRELDGCCRTLLMLHFEFSVYDAANKAAEEYSPFNRMPDLNHAVTSMEFIWNEIVIAELMASKASWLSQARRRMAELCLPTVTKRRRTALERKSYVKLLVDDLIKMRTYLLKRDRLHTLVADAIESRLPAVSIALLNFDREDKKQLHLDEDIMTTLLKQSATPLNTEHPMYSVKREWRERALRSLPFGVKDLMTAWSRCVVGIDIILEDERKFSTTVWEDRDEEPVLTRRQSAKKASQRKRDPGFCYGRGPNEDEIPQGRELRDRSRRFARVKEALQRTHMLRKASHRRWLAREDIEYGISYFRSNLPTSASAKPTNPPDIFLVVGWFSGKLQEPFETCVQVQDAKRFLPTLHKEIRAVRGWRSIFSFKTVQGFGVYKCHPRDGGHSFYEISKDEKVALSQFYGAVQRPFRLFHTTPKYTDQDSKDWAIWAYHNFNDSQKYPFRSELSLQLIIKWSQNRLIIASTIPLLLSMAVGIWYMAAHDGVEGASAAWTIASYIVTAGAFIIALLAVLSLLKDG